MAYTVCHAPIELRWDNTTDMLLYQLANKKTDVLSTLAECYPDGVTVASM